VESLGLVGLQGAGANQLFAALTGLDAPTEFESAVGVAAVPDERVDRLGAMSQSRKLVYATFQLVHIALPPGLKPGEGLGARFVGQLRDCDAMCLVLRAHDDASHGPADPEGELATIELELVMTDLASVEQRIEKQTKAAKLDKTLGPELDALALVRASLENGDPLDRSSLDAEQRALLAPVFLLTLKPRLVVVNIDEAQLDESDTIAARFGADAIAGALSIEAEIAACEPDDRDEMRESFGIGESVLPRLARAAYHTLGRRTFLTTGDDETRAWTFRAGAKAPEGAGAIHTDLQRGFIRAEVIDWRELLEIGSWSKAREVGKLRLEGKDYEVRDGDVLEIRFNV
jgi:ribosome-binding ATPase